MAQYCSKILFFVYLIIVSRLSCLEEYGTSDKLFPQSEPFETGLLQVSDLHSIHYALYGNRNARPVFVLHGGPGFGCYPRLVQYFDPKKFLVVLHDQRGTGRSLPLAELRENTTQHLVGDIERLRTHLKVGPKIMLFGGSWGSTLALAYAQTYPQHVSGIVLRGVWTGTQSEVENVLGHGCVERFFPDAVARMRATMPPKSGGLTPDALFEVFTKGDEATTKKVADAWIGFGTKIGKLHATDEEVEEGFGDFDVRPGCMVDVHYLKNGYFFEEGQLLRDAPRLKDIPAIIINGRYDMMCPPVTAYRLHRLLPKSKLIIVEGAGHLETEPGITRALIEAVAEFE